MPKIPSGAPWLSQFAFPSRSPYICGMSGAPAETILSFEEARHLVEKHASPLRPKGRELLSLLDARGRVLAESIPADRDFPPFPRATRDGYAVRSEDFEKLPAEFEVIAEIRAGADYGLVPAIGPRKAIAIMTGAAVPEGADAVVMLEHTSRSRERLRVDRSVEAGENIVPRGAEAKSGERMLSPGTRIDHAAIAVAASVGRSRVVVHAKPRVAILSTGDEVVDIDVPPGPHQIRNSNSYSLAAQVQAAGGDPVLLPVAPDDPRRLQELLNEGLESDLLLITGGVSMGKYDLVEQGLTELGAEFVFTGARIQPGKPVVFGRIPCVGGPPQPESPDNKSQAAPARYFFGLPGNPVSTMVTFELFARPVLEALTGCLPRTLLFTRAKLRSPIRTKTGLERFLPAMLTGEFEKCDVELVRWQGSGDIASLVRSNCYAVIPPDRDLIEAGEWISVILRT